MTHLDPADPAGLAAFLREKGWAQRVDAVGPAGEGNMNLSLRVSTDLGSRIVKQGRPWVEEHPDLPAPADRTLVEAAFYALVQSAPEVAARMPGLLAVDREARVLLLEDLGELDDLSVAYQEPDALTEDVLLGIGTWLRGLHEAFRGAELPPELLNTGMRELNHEHVFSLPFRAGNGLDLDAFCPGLSGRGWVGDEDVLAAVAELGDRYLTDAEPDDEQPLLHGDPFPGSWLLRDGQVWAIDPEFAFAGDAEWDLGVVVAHLDLAGADEDAAPTLLRAYGDDLGLLDDALVQRYAGVEVGRRLLGVAQLPLAADADRRHELLERARVRLVEGVAP